MTVESSDESKSQDEATSTSVWSNFNDMQFYRFDLSVGMTGIVRAAMLLTPMLGILLTMAIPRVSGIVLLSISVA
eukprot:scaffold4623_cov142-Skeletonema_menzelii.AAC.1